MGEKILIIYLILINLIGFIIMGVDKRRAKRRAYRIPERQLILCAALGGSIGSLLGMFIWHHKTKHLKFTLGIPLIMLIEAAIAVAIAYYIR